MDDAECEFCGDKINQTQQCTFCELRVHTKCLDDGLCPHCYEIIEENNKVIKIGE